MTETIVMNIEHIVKTPGVLNGRARLANRRVPVWQIALGYTRGGLTAAELADSYEVDQAAIHAALAYYFDHQMEIAAEIEEQQAAWDDAIQSALSTGNENAYVTVSEIASTFDVSPRAVREACAKGWIPARKSGGTWLIRASDARARWGDRG